MDANRGGEFGAILEEVGRAVILGFEKQYVSSEYR